MNMMAMNQTDNRFEKKRHFIRFSVSVCFFFRWFTTYIIYTYLNLNFLIKTRKFTGKFLSFFIEKKLPEIILWHTSMSVSFSDDDDVCALFLEFFNWTIVITYCVTGGEIKFWFFHFSQNLIILIWLFCFRHRK